MAFGPIFRFDDQNLAREAPSSLLGTDAPGLHAALSRVFNADAVQSLEAAYLFSVLHGGKEEHPVVRPAGASYNPRPARMVQILLHQGHVSDLSTLLAGFLVTVRDTAALEKWIDDHSRDAARVACTALSDAAFARIHSMNGIFSLVLAAAIDTVRHLHMSTLDEAARQALLRAYRDLTTAAENESCRLQKILLTALTQQERRIGV